MSSIFNTIKQWIYQFFPIFKHVPLMAQFEPICHRILRFSRIKLGCIFSYFQISGSGRAGPEKMTFTVGPGRAGPENSRARAGPGPEIFFLKSGRAGPGSKPSGPGRAGPRYSGPSNTLVHNIAVLIEADSPQAIV